jgi:CBS domain-containing protein
MLITDILRRKGTDVATIAPTATVAEAVSELGRHGIGALVVSTDGRAIDGILSERDVVRCLSRRGAAGLEDYVAHVMTTEVTTCGMDATIEELMVEMTERRFRHVPVVDGGVLAGIVSIGDVVNSRVGELEAERQHLSNYIMGR